MTDIDECFEKPSVCGVGKCVNLDGSYHCICPPGYMLLPNGSKEYILFLFKCLSKWMKMCD